MPAICCSVCFRSFACCKSVALINSTCKTSSNLVGLCQLQNIDYVVIVGKEIFGIVVLFILPWGVGGGSCLSVNWFVMPWASAVCGHCG